MLHYLSSIKYSVLGPVSAPYSRQKQDTRQYNHQMGKNAFLEFWSFASSYR